MRVAIGGFVHESNSFSPVSGSWEHFAPHQVLRGEEVVNQRVGTRSELGGIIDAARRDGVELVPLLSATGSASAGPLRREVFDALLDEMRARLGEAGPLDAVVLVLHGALVVEGIEDGTGEILRAIRADIGSGLPLIGTLDLHANVTAQMVQQATALAGYHTAPHIDMYETGQRAMALLRGILTGQTHPVVSLRRLPMIVPAENGRTTEGPYAEVMTMAEALMQQPPLLDISVFSVQPWLDVADVGCSVVVVSDGDQTLAERTADELADTFWQRRHAFAVTLEPAAEAITRALASDHHPFVLADSADATSSGAPGDSTAMLEHLLAVQPEKPCYLNIVDPQAVATLVQAGVGEEVTLQVGATSGCPFYQPTDVTGKVERITDGTFVNQGQGFRGVAMYMGQTVVLRIGQIALVVMEQAVIQWDPELYRSVGLEPRDAQIVVVKSPAAFRAAYGPFAAEITVVDVPGVCSPNLRSLPFRHVHRPLYPLDDLDQWR